MYRVKVTERGVGEGFTNEPVKRGRYDKRNCCQQHQQGGKDEHEAHRPVVRKKTLSSVNNISKKFHKKLKSNKKPQVITGDC